jgi:hypothetical protein
MCAGYQRIKASLSTHHHIYEIIINIINNIQEDLDLLSTSIIKIDEDYPHS